MPVSLREASRTLKVNRLWLRGYCDGRGYELVTIGTALCLKIDDFRAVQKAVAAKKRNKKVRAA